MRIDKSEYDQMRWAIAILTLISIFFLIILIASKNNDSTPHVMNPPCDTVFIYTDTTVAK